ncbi:AIPR family protein [Bradyrhizobium sp. LHD-71]|uniref:AIPR family protein n=1 Tax=Bradyrhizobium sp. LHD-71 TaxID=3072141 RepID=UPI00280D9867|nr:AIPR family protein [Bradyrhizobium sp. LHD-71]MDQ8731016.1 AIPR family protein [Bradyrhizobium sp. LHD-71]
MDRVTESFLADFASEHELTGLSPDKKFEHFASFVTVRRHYNGEAFVTDEVHTGGSGDTGIDAIAILVNGSLIVDVESLAEHADLSGHFDVSFIFVQADRGASFDGKKLSDFGFGVKDFFEPTPKLTRNEAIKNAAEIMDALYRSGTKFRPGNPICRLYYVTTGTWQNDADLEARRAAIETDLRSLKIFRDVSISCIGAEGVQQLYRQTKNAVSAEFTFSNRTLLPEITGVSEAYIGFITLSEFISVVSDDEGELLGSIFYENVRDWQDYTAPVNEEIRSTVLSGNRDRFVIMNNGITMIARSLRALRRDRFQIEDFQIVNGCQTTHVLFDSRDKADDSLLIPLRIVATQDEDVIKSIIRGTNRQTKVEDDQFFALTDFAEQLEDYFLTQPESHRLYYERRSGQYSRLQNVHATRIVAHRNLVRAVGAMFMSVPHQTTRSYQSLRESIGKEIFAKGQRLEPYYVAAYGLYKLDVNFRTQRLDSKLKAARFHILLAMRLLANPSQLPRMNAHEMQRYCDIVQRALWDNTKADHLCAKAAKIVERAAGGDFNRDNIRTQPFTEKVIALCDRATAR